MGLGTHQFGRMPFIGAQSLTGDRAIIKWGLWGDDQGARWSPSAGRTVSALYTKPLKPLVEAGELSTAIN
jgi:hypothetical protein